MRLIDADAVEKQAYDDVHYHAELEDWEFDVVTHYLDHAPTIDAVPVVRCKDCIHCEDLEPHADIYGDDKHCRILRGDLTSNVWHKYKKYYRDYSLVEPDGFCSEGLRKEADGNG